MGTQQILLIVLSVIIVGIAAAVGITMFNTQATNANRQAVISDLSQIGSMGMAAFRTPANQGGCGRDFLANKVNLRRWTGFPTAGGAMSNENGTYVLPDPASATGFTVTGTGFENYNGTPVVAVLVINTAVTPPDTISITN